GVAGARVAGADGDAIAAGGTDAVWLMGVWERSPAGLALANANPELMASFRAALPDLQAQDVIGSPYCVRRYVADDRFGGRPGLCAAPPPPPPPRGPPTLDRVPPHP